MSQRSRRSQERSRLGRSRPCSGERAFPRMSAGSGRGERAFPASSSRSRGRRPQGHCGDLPFPRMSPQRRSSGVSSPVTEIPKRSGERAFPRMSAGSGRGERAFPASSSRSRGLRPQGHCGDLPFPRMSLQRRSSGVSSPVTEIPKRSEERAFPRMSAVASAVPWRAPRTGKRPKRSTFPSRIGSRVAPASASRHNVPIWVTRAAIVPLSERLTVHADAPVPHAARRAPSPGGPRDRVSAPTRSESAGE